MAAGNRRFAVVTGPSDAPVSKLRTHNFCNRLNELGIWEIARYVGDYHYESGYAAAMHLLDRSINSTDSARPEVLFCANDAMALGALDAARFSLMLRIPNDVSVVGFDDIPTGRHPAYLLTTMRQPFEAMAQAATELLRHSLDDEPITHRKVLLPATLVERGSAQMLAITRSPDHADRYQ